MIRLFILLIKYQKTQNQTPSVLHF